MLTLFLCLVLSVIATENKHNAWISKALEDLDAQLEPHLSAVTPLESMEGVLHATSFKTLSSLPHLTKIKQAAVVSPAATTLPKEADNLQVLQYLQTLDALLSKNRKKPASTMADNAQDGLNAVGRNFRFADHAGKEENTKGDAQSMAAVPAAMIAKGPKEEGGKGKKKGKGKKGKGKKGKGKKGKGKGRKGKEEEQGAGRPRGSEKGHDPPQDAWEGLEQSKLVIQGIIRQAAGKRHSITSVLGQLQAEKHSAIAWVSHQKAVALHQIQTQLGVIAQIQKIIPSLESRLVDANSKQKSYQAEIERLSGVIRTPETEGENQSHEASTIKVLEHYSTTAEEVKHEAERLIKLYEKNLESSKKWVREAHDALQKWLQTQEDLLIKRLRQGESVVVGLHKELEKLQWDYRREIRKQIDLRRQIARDHIMSQPVTMDYPAYSSYPINPSYEHLLDYPTALQNEYPVITNPPFTPLATGINLVLTPGQQSTLYGFLDVNSDSKAQQRLPDFVNDGGPVTPASLASYASPLSLLRHGLQPIHPHSIYTSVPIV